MAIEGWADVAGVGESMDLDSRDGGGCCSTGGGGGGGVTVGTGGGSGGGVESFSFCGCDGPLDLDLDPITEPDKLLSKGIRLRALSRIFILSNMTRGVTGPYRAAPWSRARNAVVAMQDRVGCVREDGMSKAVLLEMNAVP